MSRHGASSRSSRSRISNRPLALLLLLLLAQLLSPAAAAASLGDELRGDQAPVVSGALAAPDVVALRAAEAATLTDHGSYTAQGAEFECSGLRCAATLYLPKQQQDQQQQPAASTPAAAAGTLPAAASTPLPAVIVMAHGLGGQRVWLDKFAAPFAAGGFAVFAFDYRHWGSSDGAPRQWISVAKQHQDWFDAVRHVQQQLRGVVDAERLSLWGTSFAGGHVIHVASKLPGQIKAVISQVPHLDGAKSTQANAAARGTRGNALVAMAALADMSGDASSPTYIPLAGKVGSTALMQLNEHDIQQYEQSHKQGLATWHNLARARFASEQSLARYSPIRDVSKVQAPLLLIAGKQDALCPFSAAQAAAAKAPRATLLAYDVGHFDLYNPPHLEENRARQLAFLRAHAA